MTELKYKTRGMSSPQGKPRVYFCCHPSDFPLYFEPISQELLEKQNCAIWYTDSPEEQRDASFLEDLEQMQLFVMPVTANLLYTENCALDVEFPFAMEHHIPVLPLMQEKGLVELFNEKCGDLQFLEKHSGDTSAIAYDEKLENYLSAVLIGDELAEKIRGAFDAYVFLSYRKKDRRYAQELMRLIHRNDFCRDIAIWYDEFLAPGENFNSSIRDALEKSGLFVLAVTPNLVNESNYVMTTEYPMAKQAGKPILPAELVPTDRELLARNYEDIPPCADAHDEEALNQALLDALARTALREKDASPEHTFFIGLAYLGGVDVEVDHKRATALITAAAEAGVVEATAKLVEMYRNGIAVPRSFENAIHWQETKIKQLKKLFRKNPGKEPLRELLYGIVDLGSYYWEFQDASKCLELYENNIRDIRWIPFWIVPEEKKRAVATLSCARGDILRMEGDLEGAKKDYEQGLAIFSALAEKHPSPEAQRDLYIGLCKLGDICNSTGDLDKAMAYYQRSLEITEELAAKDALPKVKQDIAIAYDKIAVICSSMGDIPGAKAFYQKALELSEALASEYPNLNNRHDLYIGYSHLGNICNESGDPSEARIYLEKALQVCTEIVQESDALSHRLSLSIAHRDFGCICQKLCDGDGALTHLKEAVRIMQDIRTQADTLEIRKHLAFCHSRLGEAFLTQREWADAAYNTKTAADLLEDVVSVSGAPNQANELAVCYGLLGDVYYQTDDLDRAREYFEKALHSYQQTAEKTNAVYARQNIANTFGRLGNIYRKKKQFAQATAYYHESLQVNAAIAEETGMFSARYSLAYSNVQLGRLCKDAGEIKDAKAYFLTAQELCTAIVKESDSPMARELLATCHRSLGDICKAEFDLPAAKEHYQEALALQKGLAEEANTEATQRSMAILCEKLGDICRKSRDYTAARDYLEEAHTIRDKLVEKLNIDRNRIDLAIVYDKLGSVYAALRDISQAKLYFTSALRIFSDCLSSFPTRMLRANTALSHVHTASVSSGQERQQHLEKALELYEGLSGEFPESTYYQNQLKLVREKLET